MTRKLILLSAVCCSLFTACNPNPRKATFNKSLRGIDKTLTQTTPQDAKVKEILDGKDCLPLKELTDHLKARSTQTFTTYIRNLDLVSGQDTSWTGGEDQTRARVLLIEPKPWLAEVPFGSQIADSKIAGPLMGISSQTKCDSITFGDGKVFTITSTTVKVPDPQPEEAPKPDIVKPAVPLKPGQKAPPIPPAPPKKIPGNSPATRNKGLLLQSADGELRTIYVRGNQLNYIIYQAAGHIQTCKNVAIDNLVRKTHYVIDFSGTDPDASLDPNYVSLLRVALPAPVPGLNNAAPGKGPAPSRGGFAERQQTSGIQVNTISLIKFSEQIRDNQVNSVECPTK